MKHAADPTLDSLEDLLVQIRQQLGLREKKRGVFYRQTMAWLHFHEDPAGLFADLRIGSDWQRFPVNNTAEYAILLEAIHLSC